MAVGVEFFLNEEHASANAEWDFHQQDRILIRDVVVVCSGSDS